jgi:serine/threonine-protein kinase ATR
MHPSNFEDEELRKAIEALSLTYDAPDTNSQDRCKRRKVSQADSSRMSTLMSSLGDSLGIMDVDDNFLNIEQLFL